MRRTIAVLGVAIAVLLAGCAGGHPTPSTATTSTVSTTTTPVPTTTTTPSSATTATTSTAVSKTVRNPWGKTPIDVAIVQLQNPDRPVRPLVEDALRYWETHDTAYTDFRVDYTLTNETVTADLIIRFQRDLPVETDRVTDRLGDAHLNTIAGVVDDQQVIRIKTGYTDATTLRTIEHELGHSLGLRHGDDPMPLMAAVDENATQLPMPNATTVPYPWQHRPLTVAVSMHGGMNEDLVRDQIEHTLTYYESGADGWAPENLSYELIENESAADITIQVYEYSYNTDAVDGDGSYGYVYGHDPDRDGALEYYTNATIAVAGIDERATGWHVGFWLAQSLGATDENDVPPPFVHADYEDRRSEWWE